MHDSEVHRELVATLASLKSCIRLVASAITGASGSNSSKLLGAVQRATDSAANILARLEALSVKTQRLPLETSRRLIDVDIATQIQQLLDACDPQAPWPVGDDTSLPAHSHPAWQPLHQCISDAFASLTLLSDVAAKACRRSHDPLLILEQLACQELVASCAQYLLRLQQLQPTVGAAPAAAPDAPDPQQQQELMAAAGSQELTAAAAKAVAMFASFYGPLAAATDVCSGLEQVQLQLMSGLCSSSFLSTSCQLLLLARGPLPAVGGGAVEVAASALPAACQQAGHHLLTLALLLSGDSTITSWAVQQEGTGAAPPAPTSAAGAGTAIAAGAQQAPDAADPRGPQASSGTMSRFGSTPGEGGRVQLLASLGLQLSTPPVMNFLQERLYHAGRELSAASMPQELAHIQLLPGRAVPDSSHDILASLLRALRCWRALLRSFPQLRRQLAASPAMVQLLLGVVAAAMVESTRICNMERQSLRGRVVKVCVDCLQQLAGYLGPGLVRQLLPAAVSSLAKVVAGAALFWSAHKHSVKSVELPYSGQIRCVERSTGGNMVRLNKAAEGALDVLHTMAQVVLATGGCPGSGMQPYDGVLLDSGLVAAVEAVFRGIPAASPLHVAAAELLALVLPRAAYLPEALGPSSAHLSLLTTLRKFLVSSSSSTLPDPDRELAVHVTLALEELLSRLVAGASRAAGGPNGEDGVPVSAVSKQERLAWLQLVMHAVAQLLPGVQAMCSSLLKAPDAGLVTWSRGGDCQHVLLQLVLLLQQLEALQAREPSLKLLPIMVAHKSLSVASAALQTGFYTALQGINGWPAAPAPSGSTSAVDLADQTISLLEGLTSQINPLATSSSSTTTNNNKGGCRQPGAEEGAAAAEVEGVGWVPTGQVGIPAILTRPASDGKLGSEAAVVVQVLADAASPSPPSPLFNPPAATAGTPGEQQLLLQSLVHSSLLGETQKLLLWLRQVAQEESVCSASEGFLSRSSSGALASRATMQNLSNQPSLQSEGLPRTSSTQLTGTSPTTLSQLRSAEPGASSWSVSAREAYLREALPVIGVSIPNVNTNRTSSRASSGAFRGGSPTTTGFLSAAGSSGGLGLRIRGSISGSAAAGGSAGGGAAAGSSPRLLQMESYGSLSSLASSSAWGGGLQSPASVSMGRASSLLVGSGMLEGGDLPIEADPALRALQQRLEAVLLQVAEVVAAAAAAEGASSEGVGAGLIIQQGGSSIPGSAASGMGSQEGVAAAAAAGPAEPPSAGASPTAAAAGGPFNPRSSGGAGGISKKLTTQEDVVASLRLAIEAARTIKAAAVAPGAGTKAPGGAAAGSQGLSLRGPDSPLGAALAELMLGEGVGGEGSAPNSSGGGAAEGGSGPGSAEGAVVQLPLPLVRRLLCLCASAAPLLATGYGAPCPELGAAASVDALTAQLQPLPVGCWHMGCCHLAGTSESRAALKMCSGCQLAAYCSKGCEKAAWPTHRLACPLLKEQGLLLGLRGSSGELGSAGGASGSFGSSGGWLQRTGSSFDGGAPAKVGGVRGPTYARVSAPGGLTYNTRYR